MPQSRHYKEGSIVYFEGESKNNFAFLVKSGKCIREKLSLDKKAMRQTPLVVGEFFGIKGALGILPRDETIRVISDSLVYVFSPKEFLGLLQTNSNIIFKMLRAFSNELRNIHRAIDRILGTQTSIEPGQATNAPKLRDIGLYYLKKKAYQQAQYAFAQFLNYYPQAEETEDIKRHLDIVESLLTEKSRDADSAPPIPSNQAKTEAKMTLPGKDIFMESPSSLEKESGEGELATLFNQLVAVYVNRDFNRGLALSGEIEKKFPTPFEKNKMSEKFYLLKGKILYFSGEYTEAVESAKTFVKNHPHSIWVPHALIVIAESLIQKKDMANARLVYQKILSNHFPEEIKNKVKIRMEKI